MNVKVKDRAFDLLFSIKTDQQLEDEVEYLMHRIASLASLCRDSGNSIDARIVQVLDGVLNSAAMQFKETIAQIEEKT